MTPWLRVVLSAVILSNNQEEAARRLQIDLRQMQKDLGKIKYLTKTRSPMLAAIKLGIIRIDYDHIPDWLSVDEVFLAPGLSLKVTSHGEGVDSSSWQLETQHDSTQPESHQPDPSEYPAS